MVFPPALADLESVVLEACAGEAEWPAQVAAGLCAGVDYAIDNPEVAETLAVHAAPSPDTLSRYEALVSRLAGILREKAPLEARLPGSTDEALIAGMVGLVGDHLRLGRFDRLRELRPELVLLTLLPYLGFAEAQRWANKMANQG